MKLRQLDMKLAHGRVARLNGHPAALLGALEMEKPVFLGSHGHAPFAPAAAFEPPAQHPVD